MASDKPEKDRVIVTFWEDRDIVQQLIDLGAAEGTTLSALVRRAIRRQYFSLPASPTSEPCSESRAA